ncbi:MAG: hypothetical protein ACRCZF_27540 [Gemmataceae bacterium]
MTSLEISWREIEDGDLPRVCFLCGKDAKRFVPVEIEASNVLSEMNGEVELPLCSAHAKTKRFMDHGVKAETFHNKGIIFKNACEGFADALDDYRDDPKAFRKYEKNREDDEDYDKYAYGAMTGGRNVKASSRKGMVFGCLGLVLAMLLLGVIGAVLSKSSTNNNNPPPNNRFGR